MRAKRTFEWGTDKYYFTIKSFPNNITIFRQSREAAARAFLRYKEVGKDLEWHGRWDGEQFVDTEMPEFSVA